VVGAALALVLGATIFRFGAERTFPRAYEAELDAAGESAVVRRALSFGFGSLVGEIYFMVAIQLHAERPRITTAAAWADRDRELARLLDRATDFDPSFGDAYRFAGNALPRETSDGRVTGVRAAVGVLEKGIRAGFPDWRIPFELGFIEMHYVGDFRVAANALALAAKMGAPPFVGLLATRLAVGVDDPSFAETLGRELAKSGDRAWNERLADLAMDRHIRRIEQALAAYVARTGTRPTSLDVLVESRDLDSIPAEPHGGRYVLDGDGRVVSTGGTRLDVWRDRALSGLRVE